MLKTALIKRRFLVIGSLIVLCPLLALLALSITTASRAAHATSTDAERAPVLYEVRSDRSVWIISGFPGVPLTGWLKQEIAVPNTQTAMVVAILRQVVQLQLNGTIQVYNGTGTTWTTVDASGTAAEIALSTTGQLYKENQDGTAWEYGSGTTWTQLSSAANSGPLGDLYAGPNGALYSIGATGVWKYTGTPITGWQEIDNTLANGFSAALQLLTTPNGNLYELRCNSGTNFTCMVWAYNGTPLSWKQIGTQASLNIFGDAQNNLYQLVSGGTLWKYSGSGTTWTSLNNPSPTQGAGGVASSTGAVFEYLKTTGAVWMLSNGTWTQIDSTTNTLITSDMGGVAVNSVG
jgi:hypothetical protein